MSRLYFIPFCVFIFLATPSPEVAQNNTTSVTNETIDATKPEPTVNSTSEPVLTTVLPNNETTPVDNTTNTTNASNDTEVVPVSSNNETSFGESIIATFSDPYYYASILAIFSIITIAAVSCNRRNGSGVYPSRSYDSPGLYSESKENYYISPVTAHHHHHHYAAAQSLLDKRSNILTSNFSSVLSANTSEKIQRPSIKRTQSNESIVSITSSDGLETYRAKDGKKQSKVKPSKAKRENKTTKHK